MLSLFLFGEKFTYGKFDILADEELSPVETQAGVEQNHKLYAQHN